MVYRVKNKMIYSWILLFCTLLPTATVQAGSNAGFGIALEPAQVSGPAIGEQVDFVVQVTGAVAAKHALVIAQYDSTFFEFVEFVPGDLIEGLVAPAGIAEVATGSIKEIQSGGTQLEGTPGAGAGALGTLSFVVVGEVPARLFPLHRCK